MRVTPHSNAPNSALIAAAYEAPKIAPGLPAWLECALERPLRSADLDRLELAETV